MSLRKMFTVPDLGNYQVEVKKNYAKIYSLDTGERVLIDQEQGEDPFVFCSELFNRFKKTL